MDSWGRIRRGWKASATSGRGSATSGQGSATSEASCRRLALALIPIAALAFCGSGCAGPASAEETVGIRFSQFEPETITVRAGEVTTITIVNEDPIEHEWIVGAADVHERHRTGTEPFHAEIPTEVTIPALATRTTYVTFDSPGEFEFLCHLPGHEAYGMKGTVIVVDQG